MTKNSDNNAEAFSRHVLVVAGEASGDIHGARVLERLIQLRPGLTFFGLGGPALHAQGLDLVGDPECLNIVGLSEVIGGLGRILALRKKLLLQVDVRKPRVALLVDLPGFNLNLAYQLRKRGVKVVYYIAPQAWAWQKSRVKKIRDRVDRLCVIFPFEEKFFKDEGIRASYVGHPLMEDTGMKPEMEQGTGNVIALVPGSRAKEIERMLPAMAATARLLKRRVGSLEFVVPVAPGVDEQRIKGILDQEGVEAQLVAGGAHVALARARAAIVTSGTATLEAAIHGVPMVVVYRISRASYTLVRPLYHLKNFCIVNILAGKTVVPELLQGDVRPDLLADKITELLDDGPLRQKMLNELHEVVETLRGPGPSRMVADALIMAMEESA